MISHDSNKMRELHRELHSVLPSKRALRVKALESALVAKGLLAPDTVDKWLENYSEKIGPKKGALVIARSWLDPDFKKLLEQDAIKTFEQTGFSVGIEYKLKALFNSASIHNLVVCTLCSCYPISLIGMSPFWYKSSEYRAIREREACSRNSASRLTMTSRCAFGIRPRNAAIWLCRTPCRDRRLSRDAGRAALADLDQAPEAFGGV